MNIQTYFTTHSLENILSQALPKKTFYHLMLWYKGFLLKEFLTITNPALSGKTVNISVLSGGHHWVSITGIFPSEKHFCRFHVLEAVYSHRHSTYPIIQSSEVKAGKHKKIHTYLQSFILIYNISICKTVWRILKKSKIELPYDLQLHNWIFIPQIQVEWKQGPSVPQCLYQQWSQSPNCGRNQDALQGKNG